MSKSRWLAEGDVGALRSLGVRRALPAGSTLFVQGDDPYDLMIIESGHVKLTITSRAGGELVLEVLGVGELLGELSAIDGKQRSASAVALTSLELTSIPIDRFRMYLDANPNAVRSLLDVAAGRLRTSNLRQLEYSTSDALGRVCGRLEELADRYGQRTSDGSVRIELPITQTELAQWCGLSREAVVKALRRLRTLGWLVTDDGSLTIRDLRQIAERSGL